MWNIRQVEKKHFDISLPSSPCFYFQLKPSATLNPYSQITHCPQHSTSNWINSLWEMSHWTLYNMRSKPVNNFYFLLSSFGVCWSSSNGEDSHDLVIIAQNEREKRSVLFRVGKRGERVEKWHKNLSWAKPQGGDLRKTAELSPSSEGHLTPQDQAHHCWPLWLLEQLWGRRGKWIFPRATSRVAYKGETLFSFVKTLFLASLFSQHFNRLHLKLDNHLG